MKRMVFSLVAVLLTFVALCSIAFADGETVEPVFLEITGSYADGTTGFVYSDDMLLQSSYEMSGDLAKVAVALSGAAYSADGSNASAMLASAGYTTGFFDYGSRTLDDNDKVGYVVGKKQRDDGKLLYIVVIRGTDGLEWFSDFNIGDPATNGGKHAGFDIASKRVMNTLDGLFSSDGVAAENRYILFTGHSRGAAVANILAAHYSDSGIAPESHIFGYTFACPAVSKNAGQNGYENIFNFNNTGDAIPTMPLASWGYHRYGIDNPCGFTASPAFRMKYYNEFGGENASTSDTVAYEIAIETIFPEETTVNEPLGHFGAMLLAWSLSQTNEISLHEFLIRYGKDVFTEQYLYDQVLEKTGLKPLYQLLSGDSSKYKDQQNFLKKAKSDLASFSQEEFDAWLVNNKSTLLPGSTEEEYAQWVSENRGTLSNQFKQERFDRWKAENQSMLRDIYNTTGQLIEKYADIDPVISTILKLAPIAWDAGTVIGCVIDISDNSAGGPLAAITDGHRTGTYVVGINSRYFGYHGLQGVTAVSNVTIPACVKTIGQNCFTNSGVTTVSGMDHVVFLGDRAFYNAKKLVSIGELGTVKTIRNYMFSGCTSLVELDLLGVESIGAYAFQNCTSLENLYIPDSVVELGIDNFENHYTYNGPFVGCTGLKTISVGGVETLTSGMLKTGSQALEEFTIRGTVKAIGASAFNSRNGYSTDNFAYNTNYNYNGYGLITDHPVALIIEEGVESIGSNAFYSCKMFTTVSIPSTISTIGNNAFADCDGLSILDYPGTAQPFANNSLSNCPNLIVCIMTPNDAVTDYCEARSIRYVRSDAKLTLPAVLTMIEDEAFRNSVTTWAVLPEAIESIGQFAFADCGKLSRIDIPAASVDIDPDAFNNSSRVTIFAPPGGTVQSFAEEYSIPFVAVENSVPAA